MKAWFRVLASILPAQPPAQALAGISMMTMSLYTGYSIPKVHIDSVLRCTHRLMNFTAVNDRSLEVDYICQRAS
jgi:hypothetical protein